MDLIVLVLTIALIGFVVWIIESQIPMPPIFKYVIYVIIVVAMVFFLIRRFAGHVPNVLG
jgi:hypothetical protein